MHERKLHTPRSSTIILVLTDDSGVVYCRQKYRARTAAELEVGRHVTKFPEGHVARRHYKFNQRWPPAFPEVE